MSLANKIVEFELTKGQFIFLEMAMILTKEFLETFKKEVALLHAFPTAIRILLNELDKVKQLKAKGHPDRTMTDTSLIIIEHCSQ